MKHKNKHGQLKKCKSKRKRIHDNKSKLNNKEKKSTHEKQTDYIIEEALNEEGYYQEDTDEETILEENIVNEENVSEGNESDNEQEKSDNSTSETNCNEDFNCWEEAKKRRQEILDKLRDLSQMLSYITLTRDNINWIKVDTLTEVYFTRQVRPLLDALNIISFASSSMSSVAVNINESIFGDKKEIKNSLKLSYKMNDEIEDIITALDRRLKIFLNEINKMDRNCPPFDSGRDS